MITATREFSDDQIATVSALYNHKKNPNQNSKKDKNALESRISNRINKMMKDYVNDKKSGKKRDISTEEKDYLKALKELKFRPNIAKSQTSFQTAGIKT